MIQNGFYSYSKANMLGAGSYGKVYEGKHSSTGARVAIKIIQIPFHNKYLLKALATEIELMVKIKSNHIVRCIQSCQVSDSQTCIIMQFCEGGSLKNQLKKQKSFSQYKSLFVMADILKGYKALAIQNIIHRDLKPDNILKNNNYYLISDLGFSLKLKQKAQMRGSNVGSSYYKAPQILHRRKYSRKCDVWSMGIMWFELVEGLLPWRGDTEQELLKNISSLPLKFDKIKSYSIRKLVTKMLQINEDYRISFEQLQKQFQGMRQSIQQFVPFHPCPAPVRDLMQKQNKGMRQVIQCPCTPCPAPVRDLMQKQRQVIQRSPCPPCPAPVRDLMQRQVIQRGPCPPCPAPVRDLMQKQRQSIQQFVPFPPCPAPVRDLIQKQNKEMRQVIQRGPCPPCPAPVSIQQFDPYPFCPAKTRQQKFLRNFCIKELKKHRSQWQNLIENPTALINGLILSSYMKCDFNKFDQIQNQISGHYFQALKELQLPYIPYQFSLQLNQLIQKLLIKASGRIHIVSPVQMLLSFLKGTRDSNY